MKKEEPKIPKRDARHLAESSREALRERGMQLIQKGFSQRRIAEMLGVHPQTVLGWNGRLKSLPAGQAAKEAKRGPKEESLKLRCRLTPEQEACVREKIVDRNPLQLKLEFALWTSRSVAELIRRLFGIVLPKSTMCRYLKKWGMTPQHPKKHAIQQNKEEVETWLRDRYPEISRRAKSENALIFWEDETKVQQDTNWVRGYSPKGETPVIDQDRRYCRGGPVMISAVSNQGDIHFSLHSDNVNAAMYIEFLEGLLHDNEGRKLFVIADNARIHHARIVREWAQQNKDRITLFFLPPYTPEHNPDEYLNRQLKTELRLKPAMSHQEAMKIATDFMSRLKNSGRRLVRKLFENTLTWYASRSMAYELLLPAP